MRKRTSELLFSFIGIILFGLLLVGALIAHGNIQDSKVIEELVQDFLVDENIVEVTVEQVVQFLENALVYFEVISFICVSLGLIAVVLFKRNSQTTTASNLLIFAAIIGTLFTVFTGIFASGAYLIAGIAARLKNKKVTKVVLNAHHREV